MPLERHEFSYYLGRPRGSNLKQIVVDIDSGLQERDMNRECPDEPASGDRPCNHPCLAENIEPSHHTVLGEIGGFYESRERRDTDFPSGYHPCTLQINQAGNHLYGWFQVEGPPSLPFGNRGATGEFWGILGTEPSCNVNVKLDNRTQETLSAQLMWRGIDIEPNQVDLSFSNPIHIRSRFTLEYLQAARVSSQVRVPNRYLESIRTTRPILYQGQTWPLRSGQVQGMIQFLEQEIRPKIRQILRRSSMAPRARVGGPIYALFNFFRWSLNHGVFPGSQLPGCNCPCHRHSSRGEITRRHGIASANIEQVIFSGCRCSCPTRITEGQNELAKAMLLRLLEEENFVIDSISIRTDPTRTYLECIYEIADCYHYLSNTGFDQFRRLFRAFLPDRILVPGTSEVRSIPDTRIAGRLPPQLYKYKYVFNIRYTGPPIDTAFTGINLRARPCSVEITRYESRRSGGWHQSTNQPIRMQGFLGGVVVHSSIDITEETIEESFYIICSRRWDQTQFSGYWELHGFSAAPLVGPTFLRDASVYFSGGSDSPPLACTMQDHARDGYSVDYAGIAHANWFWMPGYLWPQDGSYNAEQFDPQFSDYPPHGLQVQSTYALTFGTDQVIPRSGDRYLLGRYFAENLIFFVDRFSKLQIHGHASRRFQWRHNILLSVRRAQYVMQAMIDILGDKLQIPVNQENQRNIQLFGHGESEACEQQGRDRVPEGDDGEEWRRVDVVANRQLILRFRTQGNWSPE